MNNFEDNSILEELMEILSVDTQTEESKDGMVYGNYIYWPEYEDYDDDQIIQVLSLLGIDLPFYKNITIFEYKSLKEDFYFSISSNIFDEIEGLIDDQISDSVDSTEETKDWIKNKKFDYHTIIFPSPSNIFSSIESEFKQLDIPTGFANEENETMPLSAKYYQNEYDDFYYLENIPLKDYISEIDELYDEIKKAKKDIIKKSILLTALILTESYIKSYIANLLPEVNVENLNEHYRNVLDNYNKSKLENNKGRAKLYNAFNGRGKNLRDMPYNDLRNRLAHRIDKVKIEDNYIYKKQGSDKTVDIEKILDECKDYIAIYCDES